MIIARLFAIFVSLVLVGCASQPTVYVYGKYLSQQERARISQSLAQQHYNVEINDFDFPTSVSQNTILYSLLLKDPHTINHVVTIAEDLEWEIHHTQGLTIGNHWYTKDSVALFLFPDDPEATKHIFRQDLVNTFIGEKCGEKLVLKLDKSGDYHFEGSSKNIMDGGPYHGVWKYRQFPYLELRKHESSYSNYYFEIERFADSDDVSEIEFLKLTPVNEGYFPKGCVFLNGTRL
jgi:hypothetical protein